MASIDPARLVTRIRRELRQITLGGESTATQADYVEKAASRFSDAVLLVIALEAAVYLAGMVRGEYLPQLLDGLEPEESADWPEVARFFAGKMEADKGIRARRFRQAGLEAFIEDGAVLDEAESVYTVESGQARIYGKGAESPETSEIGVVLVPTSVDELDDRFESAIVYMVTAEALALMGQAVLADKVQAMSNGEFSPYRLPRRDPVAEAQARAAAAAAANQRRGQS